MTKNDTKRSVTAREQIRKLAGLCRLDSLRIANRTKKFPAMDPRNMRAKTTAKAIEAVKKNH